MTEKGYQVAADQSWRMACCMAGAVSPGGKRCPATQVLTKGWLPAAKTTASSKWLSGIPINAASAVFNTSRSARAPTARPLAFQPAAAAPPLNRRWNKLAVCGHVALAQGQALAVLEPAQLFGPVAGDLAVTAHG